MAEQARAARSAGAPAGAQTAWISWARTAAIVGVVALHVAAATAEGARPPGSAVEVVALVVNRAMTVAVPLFVMLSGALLLDPARYPGDAEFLRRRARRLVPAVVFWHLAYWALKVLVLDLDISPRTALTASLVGRLSTGLYFFWIVLGLALLTPVLVAWTARAGRAAVAWSGVGLAAVPVLGVATASLRGSAASVVLSAWTWWIPYVGLYLLGWALRDVVLRGGRLAAVTAGTAGLAAVTIWQYGAGEAAPAWLALVVGGYESLAGQTFAVGTFLVIRAAVRPGGLLRGLTTPGSARWGRRLGDLTLGVFAVHIAVLELSYRVPGLAGDPVAQGMVELIGRTVVVVVASYVVAFGMSRVPGVRAVV